MKHNQKLNELIKSIVALAIILVLFISVTFAWLSANVSTNIDTNEFITIAADAGLNMSYGYGDNNQGQMEFPSDCVLQEASSFEGRIIFFPLYVQSPSAKDMSEGVFNRSDLLYYREASAIDKNKSYISLDLVLSSEENTSVWLDRSSYISSEKYPEAAQALRVAFVEKKPNGNSVVFDNSPDKAFSVNEFTSYATSSGDNYYSSAPYFYPVIYTRDDGLRVSTGNTRPHSFNEYVQGNADGNVLFNLTAGEPLNVTVHIWLEGSDPHSTTSSLNADDIDVFIKFSTEYESMRTFYFKDYTLEKWVANDDCFIFAQDTEGNLYPFTKSANYSNDYTWYGDIPESVTEVNFVRYNPELQEGNTEEWNYWYAGEIGDCTTYNAFGNTAGMWSDSFSPTTITVFDGSASGDPLWNAIDEIWLAHTSFTATDGNGNEVEYNYKLSYQSDYNQWQIVIPSQVTDINFNMYPYDDSSRDLENPIWTWNTTREDEIYYTLMFDNDTGETSGYWSDELIYIDGADYTDDNTIIASYFFDNEDKDFNQWSAARAKTTNGRFKVAVPPQLMASNNTDQNANTTSVYFTNSEGWEDVNIYYWGSDSDSVSWPGSEMTEAYVNGYGQQIFKAEIPNDVDGIIFNNGSVQTVDITDVELYDGIGFYLDYQITEGNDYGKWKIGTYTSYKPGIIITRYAEYSGIWSWDKSSDGGSLHNQTSTRLATYGNNNMFRITGFDENDDLTGEWSYTDDP